MLLMIVVKDTEREAVRSQRPRREGASPGTTRCPMDLTPYLTTRTRCRPWPGNNQNVLSVDAGTVTPVLRLQGGRLARCCASSSMRAAAPSLGDEIEEAIHIEDDAPQQDYVPQAALPHVKHERTQRRNSRLSELVPKDLQQTCVLRTHTHTRECAHSLPCAYSLTTRKP